MPKILLDYFFPITSITPTPSVATGFLKQVLLVVKPASEVPVETITLCTTMAQVSALTANDEADQLFAGGKDKVYIMPMNDLDMSEALDGIGTFFTIVISSDFNKNDFTSVLASGSVTIDTFANLLTTSPDTVTVAGQVFTAQSGAVTLGDPTFRAATSDDATATSLAAQINAHAVTGPLVTATVDGSITDKVNIVSKVTGDDGNDITIAYADVGGASIGAIVSGAKLTGGAGFSIGTFKGVVAVSETDDTFLTAQALITNRAAFHTTSGNKADNMCFAFGSLLSNALDWKNQQYIQLPLADDVTTLGAANILFDDKVNFCISDDDFGNRLGLFACGGEAIVAPYIKRNLELDFQSAALSYISGNEPDYSNTQAALLEDELRKVIQKYIDRQWLTAGTVSIVLDQGNFVASGSIDISEPKALWRIFGEMSQTL